MNCNGSHNRVTKDYFAELVGVARTIPGDCVCQDCKQPLPAWWNGGQPQWIDEKELESVSK